MPRTAEERILIEIDRIGIEIGKLEAERNALTFTFARLKNSDYATAPGGRKNSNNRLLIEMIILRELEQNHNGVHSEVLLRAIETKMGKMNKSTFRTALFRMKERGLVVNVAPGEWRLPLSTK